MRVRLASEAQIPSFVTLLAAHMLVCQLVPSLFLLIAWAILVWGVFRAHTAGE